MALLVFFIAIFLGLIGWNGAIAWYLQRYIMEDDSIHHSLYRVFIAGNIVLVIAIFVVFFSVPWNSLSFAALSTALGNSSLPFKLPAL